MNLPTLSENGWVSVLQWLFPWLTEAQARGRIRKTAGSAESPLTPEPRIEGDHIVTYYDPNHHPTEDDF